MGYYTRPELVEQNLSLLKRIQRKILKKEDVKLDVPPGSNIDSEQYRLRRVLTSCTRHPEAAGGEVAGLGDLVIVRVDHDARQLVVQLKGALPPSSSPSVSFAKPAEDTALAELEEYQGEMTVLEFYPSEDFSEEELVERAEDLGFEVITDAVQELEDEDTGDRKLLYPAERLEKKKVGFDLLSD